MPYRRQPLVNNEIYHIVTRRIENELLFKDINDYYRGIFSIYEFNNFDPVSIFKRRRQIQFIKNKFRKKGQDPTSSVFIPDNRNKLVEILAFCFMPNHIHLLVRQLKDNGISMYLKKVEGGYAKYFKEKYKIKRRGYFFQDRFTSVHIKDDNQLMAVFVYIYTNPLSLIEPKWKEVGIKDSIKAIKFLEKSFKWSSYQDFLAKPNFASVTERDFMFKFMGGEQGCRNAINGWIKHKGEIKNFSEIALE